ncbi:MAG: hypothetical protein HY763_14760 [Planctomycetes bacterium]|nr:hypothetical protein [Planctomycetota bacterium]
MATPARHSDKPPFSEAPPAGRAVFWLLVLMGLSTLTPCVVLPEWRAYEALRYAEQVEQHRVEALQRSVDRQRRLLEALRTDPAVIGRLAQRDLGFRRPDEQAVSVRVPDHVQGGAPPFVAEPLRAPVPIARLIACLPNLPYDRIFCDTESRPIVMGMSVALIAIAFVLFSRRSPVEPS